MPADLKAMGASEHIAVVRAALREIGESAMYDLAGQQWTECLDCGGRNGAHFPGEPDAPGSGCHVADASAAIDELARRLSELEQWKREAMLVLEDWDKAYELVKTPRDIGLRKSAVVAECLSKLERENVRLKGRIVVASDALTNDDDQEAYHQLYAAVDPDFKHADGSPFDLWREHAERLLEAP